MKRTLTLFLCLMLLVLPLAGCFGSGGDQTSQNDGGAGGWAKTDSPNPAEQTRVPQSDQTAAPIPQGGDFSGRSDIAYVLIFNPDIYDESMDWNKKLTTGSIGSQIDISMNRADELDPVESPFKPISQMSSAELFAQFGDEIDLDRAGGVQPIYSVGDRHDFYAGYEYRDLYTFNCVYAGEHCYIWSVNGSISSSQANKVGNEFDSRIYDADVTAFGTPRYADEGGKIHLLYYPMSGGTLGFFSPSEIFATGEYFTAEEAAQYGINLDYAIINLNSEILGIPEYENLIYATTAHEFQHLINSSDMFYTLNPVRIGYTDTWLNEAMSGYIEEKLYPGVKEAEGHYDSFIRSQRIRHGQSLFNFGTDTNSFNFDIGVYGSVFLFSQYLENIAGSDVFHRIHDYWRTSYSYSLCDAEALYNAVPSSVVSRIDAEYVYPSNVSFDSPEKEWMSKLALDFYMSLLSFDANDPAAYAKVQAQTLLYDEINPADIEGGGRVIAATKDGTFEIPNDADYGLLYIGLDANFRPITGIIYK